MQLQNTTALVTGGAKRVGLSISLALARAGCDVVVHYHNSREEAESAAKQIEAFGRRAFLVQADLSHAAEINRLLTNVENVCPPIEILINSAAVYYSTPLAETTADQWDHTLNTNLRAPFLFARELGLKMAQRGRGKVINITDCAVRRPYRGFAPYLVSKAALVALTEVLALELAPYVQVNCIAPGTVLLPQDVTAEQQEQCIRRAPLKKIGSPEDVAQLALHLIECGDFMTGGYYPVDGGAGMR